MDSINYSNDSRDGDTIAFLIANNLLPGLDSNSAVKHKVLTLDKRPNVKQDFDGAYQRLMNEYFKESSNYSEVLFEKRFRMS